MAPTESSILSSFLLNPAPLPTVLSLAEFVALFPASVRSSAQIPHLYRALQHRRALDIDRVRANIRAEVGRGEAQQRQVARQRWRDERGVDAVEDTDSDGGREVRMEGLVYGEHPDAERRAARPHSLKTVVPALERACRDVKEEIRELNDEAEDIMKELRLTVSDLSGLRYGRLERAPGGGELREEVLAGMVALRRSCEEKLAVNA